MVLIVDLAVQGGNLELAHQVGHSAHRTVAQKHRGFAVDNGDFVIVHFLNVLSELHIGGLKDACVLLGIAREERNRHEGSYEHQRENDHGNEREHLESFCLASVARHLGSSVFVCAGFRAEEQKCRQQNEHRNKHPRIDTVDVDGRMEPPIRGGKGDDGHDDERDQRLFAHTCELILELAEIFRRIELDMRRSLLRSLPRAKWIIHAEHGEEWILVACHVFPSLCIKPICNGRLRYAGARQRVGQTYALATRWRNTYCRMPPWAMYAPSVGVSTRTIA